MYCKLCGKHLYQDMNLSLLFKRKYEIHVSCEKLLNHSEDYITVPVIEKLLLVDYLFETQMKDSDVNFLFHRYWSMMLDRAMKNQIWSIVLFVEDSISNENLLTVLYLADHSVLLCKTFYENL